jgi:hypothetical protein
VYEEVHEEAAAWVWEPTVAMTTTAKRVSARTFYVEVQMSLKLVLLEVLLEVVSYPVES